MKTSYDPKYSPTFTLTYTSNQEFIDSLPYIYNTLDSCLTPIILHFNNTRKFSLPIDYDIKLDKILRGTNYIYNPAPEEYKDSADLFDRILYRMSVNYFDRSQVVKIPLTVAKTKQFLNSLGNLYTSGADTSISYKNKKPKISNCIVCETQGKYYWEANSFIPYTNKYKKSLKLHLTKQIHICNPCRQTNKLVPLDLVPIYAKLIPRHLDYPALVPQDILDKFKCK